MLPKHLPLSFVCLLMLLCAGMTQAQEISGTVVDKLSKEPLFSATVVVKGTTIGATTDFDGKFAFNPDRLPPFTLTITYLGYEENEFLVTQDNFGSPLKIRMSESSVVVAEVEIKAQRLSEKQKETPLTVESMSLAAIEETPAASFYNGLGALKGVDLTTASMGFVIVNTRGFNSTRPVRSLQMLDGADNQAPGLNFSIGNFVGASELDIQKVDLIVGASTAYYGPNAFNGVINMTTRNPFYHPGLSASVKVGERGLFETGLRYARKFQNKAGDDKFAFKMNLHYLRANDWEATNLAPTEDSEVNETNPGGYDAVNIYGDENLTSGTNNFTDLFGRRNFPGLGIYHRTGYDERVLVDYDTRNIKAGASAHYRIKPDVEATIGYHFGTGTTVYQGDNRYSLKGLRFHQYKAEVSKKDKFFVRGYYTRENAADTYDAVFTALLLQQTAKPNVDWSQDYNSYYITNVRPKIWSLPGFPNPNDPNSPSYFADGGGPNLSTYSLADSIMQVFGDSINAWHAEARAFADGPGNPSQNNNQAFFQPGTERFDSLFREITSRSTFLESGSKFFDKSALMHYQAEYKFQPNFLDFTVGGSYRMYLPNSKGTIFTDTSGVKIRNWEVGLYGGVQKKFVEDRVVLNGTFRVDKNENFPFSFSPAASVVYKQNDANTWRFSFSSAIRNPTLQDQFLFYNVGRALLIGNLNGVNGLVTSDSFFESFEGQSFNPGALSYINIPAVRPEKVKTLEVGYKGTVLDRIFLDASYYYSWYKDFLGYTIAADVDIDTVQGAPVFSGSQFYRVSANSPDQVTTQGFSIAATYGFAKYFAVTGNYSWNKLDRKGSEDEIIPAFNTPEHKFNVGISGRDIVVNLKNVSLKNWGFNVNYKWSEGFLYEGSPQFTGNIESFGMLDAQINYAIPRIHTTAKLGVTNLLDDRKFQTYGGPFIGRMAYFQLLLELDKL